MAAVNANTALNELINSLDLSKVPDKLHCPGCHNFLANAFKTPCCDQAICEICQSSIKDQCPVCDHSPLGPDLCNPSKAVRTTAKAYLKTAEKKLADERAKVEAAAAPFSTSALSEPATPIQDGRKGDLRASSISLVEPEIAPVETEQSIVDQPQPSIETPSQNEVRIPDGADLAVRDEWKREPQGLKEDSKDEEETEQTEKQQHDPTGLGDRNKPSKIDGHVVSSGTNSNDFLNVMGPNPGFNNGMDFSQMMQFMSSDMGNGMTNFNSMMNMPNTGMGLAPGMFGNMGSPGMGMAGMSGMNMGMNMNFNPNQGAYGGWNSGQNMWNGPQNNNPNAFSNGMGGDFGPNAGFGYNMSQQGNFHQQQYPNGDFQSGFYGRGSFRGRGRARGGFRGRGGLNQNFQGNLSTRYQQPYEQQQVHIQQLQAQLGDHLKEKPATPSNGETEEQLKAFHDELAPGGQEEVDEALGAESTKPDLAERADAAGENIHRKEDERDQKDEAQDGLDIRSSEPVDINSHVEPIQAIATVSPTQEEPTPNNLDLPAEDKGDLDVQQSMPPPSAPLGPAAHFPDALRDHGFRSRGPGRFSTRGRGILHLSNDIHSPSRLAADPPFKAPTEPKGAGIVGAPTGPKAMRSAPPTPTGPRGRGGGFQIVGRAAMINKQNRSGSGDFESRTADYRNEERSQSGSPSYQDSKSGRHHAASNHGAESDVERRHHREHRHRRSKRDNYEDAETQDDAGHDYSRSSTPEAKRKSSHRHRDKERYSSNSKKGSSHRSHRHRDEEPEDSFYEDEASNRRRKPSKDRDLPTETESRGSTHRKHHRSSRSSRHDDKDRDRGRERDRDRDREDRHSRRHHKRSRPDHDQDADKDGDEAVSSHLESRHRSRRRKRDHNHEQAPEPGNGNPTTTHRESSRRAPQVTSASTPTEPEMDIHTLERQARNRERLLKEQQRRENAEKGRSGGGGSGGGGARRMSYKYEDEAHAMMVERERERDRWR